MTKGVLIATAGAVCLLLAGPPGLTGDAAAQTATDDASSTPSVVTKIDEAAFPFGLATDVDGDAALSQSDSGPVEVDDPLFRLQWYLRTIRAPQAWRVTLGTPEITVAIVDTGVDPDHLDLTGAFDMDALGRFGVDLRDGGRRPYANGPADWHGTAIAGIVGARADDGYGMAGVAPQVTILPIKIYQSVDDRQPPVVNGYDLAIEGIRAARDRGADVILLTWGGPDQSLALRAAIASAGVPVVVAAGNDGVDLTDSPSQRSYPAGYNLANMVTVAASTPEDTVWSDREIGRSNVGARHVDIAAPGDAIIGPWADREHRAHSGTSFAAPQVAGALALALSVAPSASPELLISELTRTARRTSGFEDEVTSGGIVDVAAFLDAVQRPACVDDLPVAGFTDVPRSSVHASSIDCIAAFGLTTGTGDGRYGPDGPVTRGQMASLLARLLVRTGTIDADELEPADSSTETDGSSDPDGAQEVEGQAFDDIAGNVHAAAIEALTSRDIARGFDDDTFRPGVPLRRDQMAALLVRTYLLAAGTDAPEPRDWFDDTGGIVHEHAIGEARELGITRGTATPRMFDPGSTINRAQVASQIARSLDALARNDVALDAG